MGIELLKIGIKMRKGVIFTIKGCFKSACNHPFLVCLLAVLMFMYRSSPFMFSLLVSASPVLICTAALLGTLLYFGQPNIPEIEIKEKTTHEAMPIKTELSKNATVVEQNESYYVERYSEKRRDEVEQPTVGLSLSERKVDETCREGSVDVAAPLNEERSRENESENGEILGAKRGLDDGVDKQKTEWNDERLSDGEVMESQYASIPKLNDLESEYEKSEADSFDSELVNVDSPQSPPRSAWKQVKQQEDEQEDEEDDALDSGSDRAESSSPDASMADITPMLDELHPLLDEEAPEPVQMSRVDSDAASEQSPQSSTSSTGSVDEIENHEDSEVADDDNEDGDDDDDAQGDKEDETKSAITWTEEDQKNLMDLGCSEIERNQRLEKLILRRRSRKNMSMVPEINLIDLESSDFPIHIAPISTTRQNPFDFPNDSYDNSGIPQIPGSAPPILLPRRNPFDIPYDSSEVKPDIMQDEFQEELKASQSREPFFRRRESFNVGPSVFAPNRQERQDLKWRPYFVPEQMGLEESNYSTLQRQSSEMCDSKASSVPETESVSSVEDPEDQKLEKEDDTQELDMNLRMGEVIEPEIISKMKHFSEDVGHGSQSSEGEETLELGSVEKRDIEVNDFKFQAQDVKDQYEEGSVARPVEVQATGYNSSSEAVEQKYSGGSSASSLSEVSERVLTEIDGEGLSTLDGRGHSVAVEPDISRQTSDLSIATTLVDDIPHKEPVYDSSPPALGKNFSSSSISCDVHAESDPGFPPVLVKQTVSESREIEKGIPTNIEMLPEPPKLHLADEHDSTRVDSNVQAHDHINSDFSGTDQRSEIQGAPEVHGVQCHASVPSNSCPDASSDENLTHQRAQGNKNLGQSEEEKHLTISERESSIPVGASAVKGQVEVEHSIDKGETLVSPNSNGDYHDGNGKLISTPSTGGSTSHFNDIAMHEPEFEHLENVQVPSTPVGSSEKVRSIQNIPVLEIHEIDHDISPNSKSQFVPDSMSRPSGASEEALSHVDTQTIHEEADEIKEIDKGSSSRLNSLKLKPKTDTRSAEVKAETVDSSVREESSVREASSVAAEKPENEAKAPEDAHSTTSDKDKGNSSKSSSSSSSSSSEASSSDSEENEKVVSANRRFSTPF